MRRDSITMTAEPGDFSVEAQVPGRYVAATTGRLIAVYWVGDADLEAARFLHQLCEKQTQGRTRMASALHLVHPSVSLPNPEVRTQLIQSMTAFADVTCGIGVVLLGTGFWASAMRSALTGIRMVVPVGPSQMRFGQSSEEIVTWLASAHEAAAHEPLCSADPRAFVQQLRRLVES